MHFRSDTLEAVERSSEQVEAGKDERTAGSFRELLAARFGSDDDRRRRPAGERAAKAADQRELREAL